MKVLSSTASTALSGVPATRPVDINKLNPDDAAVHRWYRFVLSFPPHLVQTYLQRFGIQPGQIVLDPFCGTGTTIVECKKQGIEAIGLEKNSIAFFASQVKVDWTLDPDLLLEHATLIAQKTHADLDRQGIGTELNLVRDSTLSGGTKYGLRRLPAEVEKLLLRGSISEIPLHKTLMLIDNIDSHAPSRFSEHERLALAHALVFGIGNVQFGPEVGVGPAKIDAPVILLWMDHIRRIADDLRAVRTLQSAPSHVYFADARDIGDVLPAARVDAVITSPPYPNEKDYTRTTRLESVLLGFIKNKQQLRKLKAGLVRSNTRGVYKGDSDDEWVKDNEAVQSIANAIEERRIELGKTSGFERMYPRVTRLYFGGMAKHLAELRHVLKPGAQLAYVLGDQASYLRVMIRTSELLAEIATSLGYVVTGTDLFRTRLATATKAQLNEDVLLLRWPG